MTKAFKNIARQGDVLFVKVSEMPEGVKLAHVINGHYEVAHSETGHSHVLDRTRGELYEAADDQFTAWIKTLDDGAEVTHQRSFDTHETIALEPNSIYRVHRQREWAPEGWRRAAD